MNPEEQALLRVVRLLEDLKVPYMVTGSLASSFHGRPRSTHDADVVIDPDAAQLEALARRLSDEGFLVSAERARDALRNRRQFNAIETANAFKVDLIVCKDRPFSREELARRALAELAAGLQVFVASPEDTILSKLEWAQKAGGSERQIDDARGVMAVNPGLDFDYLDRWAAALGIADLWHHVAGR